MKNKVVLLGVTALAVATFGICVFAGTGRGLVIPADAVEKEINLDNNALKEISLSSYHLDTTYAEGQSPDDNRKFNYAIDSEHYALGAVLFADCKNQEVGSTLGDTFNTDNSVCFEENASNFNIVFNVRGVEQIKLGFDIKVEDYRADKSVPLPEIDFKYLGKFERYTKGDIYDALEDSDYTYAKLVGEPGHGNFWTDGDAQNGSIASGTYTSSGYCEMQPIFAPNDNLVSFQLNTQSVPAMCTLRYTLTQIYIKYTCA